MKIAHYIPAYRRQMTWETHCCAKRSALWASQNDIEIVDMSSRGPWLHVARNLAFEDAWKQGCDYILMQDADVYAPSDIALERLLVSMELGEAHVVGAAVERRGRRQRTNCKPCFPGRLYPGRVGTGLMLIDVKAVAEIERPLFRFETTAKGLSVKTGEDIGFCKHAQASGLTVLVDYTFETVHLGEQEHRTSIYASVDDDELDMEVAPTGDSIEVVQCVGEFSDWVHVTPHYATASGESQVAETAAVSAGGEG